MHKIILEIEINISGDEHKKKKYEEIQLPEIFVLVHLH